MKPIRPHVTVDVKLASFPMPRPKYAVMIDKKPSELLEFSNANPGVFVFPFFTMRARKCPDCSKLSHDWIVRPFYIGNLKPQESVIRQFVSAAFGLPLSQCDDINNPDDHKFTTRED